ncbi:MAG: hypothetical protein ACRC6V_02105 [Bacteroidales bacterium]
MAWKGVGRSGIGDQTIIGEYEDWDGLSMNGRQFKNRLTQETRDLSGADYWYQRKALEPKLAEDIPTYVHGRANIEAFADPVAKPKQTKPSPTAFEKICTSDSTYEKLCNLSEELDQQLDAKQIDWNDYIYARKQLDAKLDSAWKKVCKNRGWNELLEPEQCYPTGEEFTLDFEAKTQRKYDYSVIPSGSVFAELDDGNVFKRIYTNLLTGYKALVKIAARSKQILEEGLV